MIFSNIDKFPKIMINFNNFNWNFFISLLKKKWFKSALGNHNGKPMFEQLKAIVEEYNGSGQGRVKWNAFILCIITNLMAWVHEKICQL